ncbi:MULTISPECIES: hypothetical protein [unclassified Mesorhizobium]|nr:MULTISPECIES: hypothetical protein [unclassified Mesorhizobium]TGS22411.1 hypothetical protein EN830_26190 [Mesorhizobium sp. M1C.F.Ca.ET.187.01.1.1]
MVMRGFVKPAQDKCDAPSHRKQVPAVTPEERRRAMLEFAEALAIADARRDHLIDNGVSIDRNSAIDVDHTQKAPET